MVLHRDLSKDIHKIRARHDADDLIVFHNRDHALIIVDDDLGDFAHVRIRRNRADVMLHVVFHTDFTELMIHSPLRCLDIQNACQSVCARIIDRHGFESKVEHHFIGFADQCTGLYADGRSGHIGAYGLELILQMQLTQNGFAHSRQEHISDGGRGCIGMSAAAEERADIADIDGISFAACNDLNAIFDLAEHKDHLMLARLHELVGEKGAVTGLLHGYVGNDHVMVLHTVGLTVFNEGIEHLDLQTIELLHFKIGDVHNFHTAVSEPGSGSEISGGRGGVGESACILVDAKGK